MGFTIPAIDLSSAAEATLPVPGSSASVPILLTASVLLLAVDASMQAYRGRGQSPQQQSSAIISPNPRSSPSDGDACQPQLSELVTKTRRVLGEVQTLEKQLLAEKTRCQRPAPPPHQPSTHFATRPQPTRQGSITCVVESQSTKSVTPEFSSFCERLLLVNQVWKQEKELKDLRASEKELKRERNDKAFNSFCDQLLFWNRVWKLEKEVKDLVENGERLKRGRIAAITTAAKRMVEDVQKERMVEELVKDMNGEIDRYKQDIQDLKEAHEKETLEVHSDWLKEYMGLRRELESLRIAQTARLAEQAVSSELEDSLVERMKAGQKKVEELEAQLAIYEEASDDITDTAVDSKEGDLTLVDFDTLSTDDESTDVEMSELSTSSTCVSASARRISIPLPSSSACKRCISMQTSKGSLLFRVSTPSKVNFGDNGPETVLEFKPIVVDNAASKAALTASLAGLTRSCNHSGRPQAVLNRVPSLSSLRRPSSLQKGAVAKSGGTMKPRAPWRV